MRYASAIRKNIKKYICARLNDDFDAEKYPVLRSKLLRTSLATSRARVRTDEERVLRGRWTEMRLIMKVGCENFVGTGKWEELVFYVFGDPETVERAQDGRLRRLNDSTSNYRVLDMLETG